MSKTTDNLKAALAGEAQARAKYKAFAGIARKAGLPTIAAIFEETADNEFEHAKKIMKLLTMLGDTPANLRVAIDGEDYEWQQMYPTFAAQAKEEGEAAAARYFEHVMAAEKAHAERYRDLLKALEGGTMHTADRPVTWRCTNCGWVTTAQEAPNVCPVCDHPQGYFQQVCA